MHPGLCKLVAAATLALWAAACTNAPSQQVAAAPESERPEPRGLDPSFEAAFEVLTAAVDAHDDELGRQILAGIMGRNPSGDTLQQAEAFGRVLEGRRLTGELRASLTGEPIGEPGEEAERIRIVLVVEHDLSSAVRVKTAPGILKLLLNALDPLGFEQRTAKTVNVDQVTEFVVPAGEPARVEVGEFDLQPRTSLAVRGRWELELRSGEVGYEGRVYPANDIVVEPFSAVQLAPYLPSGVVEPEELVRYLRGRTFSVPAMLERTVRIAPERRGEALDLMTPLVVEASGPEVERAVPALRWLSGNRHLGGDAQAWRQWLRARAERRAESGGEEAVLVLPRKEAG